MYEKGLYSFSVVKVLWGLNEKIFYVWVYNCKEVDCIVLDIFGGCKEGYWVWSYKMNFFVNVVGKWVVKVVIEFG